MRMGWHYLVASAIAIELSLCCNYVLNNNWTFADRRSGAFALDGFLRYHTVCAGGMVVNLVILHVLAGVLGLPALLGNFVGIAAATVWNLSLHLCWTWPRRQTASTGIPALLPLRD